MTRISNYPIDASVSLDDLLIGSKSPNPGGVTKNYQISDVLALASDAVAVLTPHNQTAYAGASNTYTQSKNLVYITWSGASGVFEYILPSAAAIPYRVIRFVNDDSISASDKIHITAPSQETIDGAAYYTLNKPYRGVAVWSDGTQWIVIQAKS